MKETSQKSKLADLDTIDKQIITLLQQNPSITHTEIAEKIERSQPTVGLRINKLFESGLFKIQSGVNLKKTELYLAKISVKTKDPNLISDVCNACPFMLNCFRIDGEYNVCFFLASSDLKVIDQIVNIHFRSKTGTKRTKTEIITATAKSFILPIDFNGQMKHNPLNHEECLTECKYCQQIIP